MKYNVKKRLHLYSFLLLEKQEIKEICANLETEISQYVKENAPKDLKRNNTVEKKEQIEKKIPVSTKDIKKIYRKIASKIHPDLNPEGNKGDKFSEAAQAYAENDVGKLLIIAVEENISVEDLSLETTNDLDKNIESLEEDIRNLKETTAWKWHLATTEEEKNKIAQNIINHIKENNNARE